MTKVVFTGCSFTAGNGWATANPKESAKIEVKDHPDLWVNLCHCNIDDLKNLELINLAQGGASNTDIFENTVKSIATHGNQISYLFCQWTAMPRYNFRVGFELWNTNESLQNSSLRSPGGVNLNRGDSWSREYLNDLLDRLLVLHHLHGEIVKVVGYTSIISQLCKKFNIACGFINGLCPWDQDYFVRLNTDTVKPEQFTKFTKTDILNIETRDDQDIYNLYNQAHNEYELAGGIDPANWINLYNSMISTQTDYNNDNIHPGKHSNLNYYNSVKQFLETQ